MGERRRFAAGPVPFPPLSPTETQFGGWYLRGDVGVGVNATAPALEATPDPIATGLAAGFEASAAGQTFHNTTLSPFGMIDFGAGYQVNSWFRADATLEYRAGAGLHSVSAAYRGPAQYADFYRGDVASMVGLVNGYATVGTWYGLTPFLGAGVGFANNKVSGFTDQGFGYAERLSLSPSGGYFANASGASFAWALMAGVDYDISANLKLEFGYRYLNYGSITTGRSNCLASAGGGTFSAASCGGGDASTITSRNRLASSDFRLGLILLFGEASPSQTAAR
jgi:opacity protein-like surface antigen